MKIIYAGSPQFAVKPLERLLNSGKAEIAAVITQPDKPVGRKKILTPTPVKLFAAERGLKVFDFEKISGNVSEISAIGADAMITCAYGQILSQQVLDCFPCGVWNLHASLLPEFRGASPVQAAILAGKEYTGVTVMKTELNLDSGDIMLVKRCEIGNKTCGELSEKLSEIAADCAAEALELLESGRVQLLLQDESAATYCKKLQKSDCKIDFNAPAEQVLRIIRAFSPEPAAYCFLKGNSLNILNAELSHSEGKSGEVISADKRGFIVACGKNAIQVTLLQPAGGKIMSARDFVNGRKIKVGDILD